jgi:hypothetical protein
VSGRARRIAAALTATTLVALPLSGSLGEPAASAQQTAPPALVVTLTGLTPIAPQPGQNVVVSGTVRNLTATPVNDPAVQLSIGGPVGSRSQFDDFADDPTASLSLNGFESLGSATPLGSDRLGAGATAGFQITVPATTLTSLLPAGGPWQVRELGIVAIGFNAAKLSESGTLRTFLPWAPRSVPGGGTPIQLAWVWPLVDRPHRGVGNAWLDDALAPELSGQGRLEGLVHAGDAAEHPVAPPPTGRHHRHHRAAPPAVPVAWAIDPMLVQDATLMSKGYTVRAANGHTTTGKGRAAATAWLSQLNSALAGADVVPLPYGDPDQVAAVRGGLASEVGVATAAGRDQLSKELPDSHLLDLAWPVNGFADSRTLATMFSTGSTSVLLSSDALPIVGGQPSETPSARTPEQTGDGELNTIVFDSGISSIVDQGATNHTQSALDLQRFLAETLMIEAEAPSQERSVVVAPVRRWQPTASYASALLNDTANVPWLAPASLPGVLLSPPYTRVDRGALDYPSSAKHAELRQSYLQQVRVLRSQLVGFGTVLTSDAAAAANYDAALQRLLSSAYRTDTAARNTALTTFRGDLDSEMSQVKIATPKGSFVTLTSHNGKVPITVSNGLDTPVRVIVQVDRNQRLGVANAGRTSVIAIPANTQVSVPLRATAKTSGVFPMQVRLLTPNLHRYGASVQLYVRSTAYGTITLVITAAATIALLIAVAIRLTRRALNAKRAARATA